MKILGIAGRKQAGKTTVANILHGEILKQKQFILDYTINSNGKLVIQTTNKDDVEGWGEFDIERKDEAFFEYAHYNMWPFIKLYNFADPLKDMCINLFNIPYENLYGTDEQKNQKIEHLQWANMPGVGLFNMTKMAGYQEVKEGEMTSREFMQYLGTEVMRKMHQDVWANACVNKMKKENSELAIVADVRFPNEVEVIKKAGGKVLRLERNPFNDDHDSEKALDADNYDHDNFWHVLDNSDNKIEETQKEIVKLLGEL